MSDSKFPTLLKHTANGDQSWEIWVTRTPNDTGVMHTRYGKVGGKLQTIEEEITEGKNKGRSNATTAYEQACAEAAARWEKQKSRKGYGLTAAESKATREVSPMLAHVYEKHKQKVNWETALAQPKLDGFRCMAHVHANGSVQLFSRENQPLSALEHLSTVLRESVPDWPTSLRGTDAVILDGELYCHGMSLNEISSACKKKTEKSNKIQYHVYDMASPMAFLERSLRVNSLLVTIKHPLLVPVHTVKVRSENELFTCRKEFMEEGYEGAMLRHSHEGYEAGKRSSNLLKAKTWLDAEFKVVDYKMGRGKYALAPIFVCETDRENHFDVLAPGDMEAKAAFGRNPKKYLGKMLTVRFIYMTKTAQPVPFLPVAKCFL